ncbi:unnamed protein product [Ascophyllum nodosum]
MDLSRLELNGAMEATTRVMVVDLPDPLEALPAEEVACHNDMLSVGMQPGEAEVLPIRVIATIITASILPAWCDRSKTSCCSSPTGPDGDGQRAPFCAALPRYGISSLVGGDAADQLQVR